MSSPQDLASGTNSRAVYKERVGDRRIKQFDARKFPHARTNVLTPYPTVNQVTSISGFACKSKANGSLDRGTRILWDVVGWGGVL